MVARGRLMSRCSSSSPTVGPRIAVWMVVIGGCGYPLFGGTKVKTDRDGGGSARTGDAAVAAPAADAAENADTVGRSDQGTSNGSTGAGEAGMTAGDDGAAPDAPVAAGDGGTAVDVPVADSPAADSRAG